MIRMTYSYVTGSGRLCESINMYINLYMYTYTVKRNQEREENICIWNILHTCNVIETILIFTTRLMIRMTYMYSYVTGSGRLSESINMYIHLHMYTYTVKRNPSFKLFKREKGIYANEIFYTCNVIETILIFTDIAFNVTNWNLKKKKSSCVSLPNLRGIYVVTSTCLEVHFG